MFSSHKFTNKNPGKNLRPFRKPELNTSSNEKQISICDITVSSHSSSDFGELPNPPSFHGEEKEFFCFSVCLFVFFFFFFLILFLRMNRLKNGLKFFFCSFENTWSLNLIDRGTLVNVIAHPMCFFVMMVWRLVMVYDFFNGFLGFLNKIGCADIRIWRNKTRLGNLRNTTTTYETKSYSYCGASHMKQVMVIKKTSRNPVTQRKIVQRNCHSSRLI